jgi:hypothetical protein
LSLLSLLKVTKRQIRNGIESIKILLNHLIFIYLAPLRKLINVRLKEPPLPIEIRHI